MGDPEAGAYAPVALWACMSSLTGGADPIAAMVERRIKDGSTEWRALWLIDNTLAYGSVVKGKEGWSAHSEAPGDDQPDATTGWSRPIRGICAVEIADARCRHVEGWSDSGKVWTWSSAARIVFKEGESVDLPPFGEAASDDADARVQEFLKELTSRL